MPKDATENCAAIARIIKDFCSCSEVGAWSPVMTEDANTQRFNDYNRDAFLKTELTNMAAMKKRIITIAKRKGRHWRNQDKAPTTLAPIDEDKACNSFEEKDFYKPKRTTFEAQRRENTLIDIYTSSRNYSTCGENWSLSRVWKNHLPYGILNDLSYVPPELRTNSLKQPLIKPFTSNAHRSKTYGGRRNERNSFRSDRSHIIDRRQMKEQLRYDRNIKRHIRIRFMLSLRMRRYMKLKFPTLPERKPIMGDFQRSRANIPTKEFPRTNSSKWKTIDNSSFGTRSYRSVTSNLRREGIVLFDVNEARNEVLSLCHDDWDDMDTLEIALLGGNFRSGRAAVGGWVRGRAMPSARAARAANGALALHYAAARGCLDCVRLLATSTPHASANTAMDNDVTPVYLAAQEGHLEVLKYLVLEAGGELNARARDGMQPVHASAQTGCLDCLKWMIVERGVDPNSRDGDGATPLHFAASRGHLPTVRWLLRHGARLHLDRHGKSPINDAADNHHVECLNVLVAAGAEAGAEGAGAKHLAAYKTVHACVCRPGDGKCILPGCTNMGARTPGAESRARRRDSSERAPFYLHAPAAPTPAHAPSDGLYVNPMARKDATAVSTPAHDTHAVMSASGASSGEESSESGGGISRSDSGFYLHHVHLPAEPTYHRVRDLFDAPPPASRGRAEGEETPDNGMTVKAEMHSSSSGAGSDGSLSGASDASDAPDTPDAPDVPLVARLDADHHYEDIYLAREDIHRNRSNSRDSGSHSRSGSSSSSSGIVVKLSPQRTKSPTVTAVRDSHANAKGQKKHLSEDASREKNGHATLQSKLSSLGAKASTFASKLASHASTINKSSNNVSSGASSGVSSAGCSSDEAGGPPPPPPPPPQPRDSAPPALPVAALPSDTPASALPVEHTRTNGARGRRNSIAGAAGSPTPDVVIGGANDRYSRVTPNLVNKQLVLPFVPPIFPHQLQSNRLIKPSEYLRSITTSASSKYSSDTEDGYQPVEQMKPSTEEQESGNHNAPPPPPPPPQESPTTRKHQQPLSAISIQDLNSVQLRRTDKIMASKTLSAPARSMSMQCLATEPFQAQKTDLIAELKMSKDITGIKKMKVERAKIENMVDKDVYSEYTKQYTVDNFVDQVPERDASGNLIPAWKRQMLARRAAERARRDLERRVAGEAERRRALAVPAWKRQLLARREEAEQRLKSTIYQSKASLEACNGFMAHELSNGNCWRTPLQYGQQRAVSIDNINLAVDYEDHRSNGKHYNDTNCLQYDNNGPEVPKENDTANVKAAVTNGNHNGDSDDDGRIIPWRAQLRKTNSKLNLLD